MTAAIDPGYLQPPHHDVVDALRRARAEGLTPLGEIKLVNYDMGKIASNRTQWIADWRKALQNR